MVFILDINDIDLPAPRKSYPSSPSLGLPAGTSKAIGSHASHTAGAVYQRPSGTTLVPNPQAAAIIIPFDGFEVEAFSKATTPEETLEKRAIKTVNFVKQTLAGIIYAVTGSYARKILNNENDFNDTSDIDVVVKESELENAVRRFIKQISISPQVTPIKPYAHTLFSKTLQKKLEKEEMEKSLYTIEQRERKISTHYREAKTFRELIITPPPETGRIPFHLIGSLKNEQRSKFVKKDGIYYLEPVSLTSLL